MKRLILAVMIISLLGILQSCGTAHAYETMSTRQSERMAIQKNDFQSKKVQNQIPFKFKKSEATIFQKFAFLGENNFRNRMLIGLQAALLNNIRKNGRTFDAYFRADSAYMSSK
jgi:hypothetical protein